MSFAKFVFDVIDKVCKNDQNAISYGEMQSEKDVVFDDSHKYGKLDIYAKEFDSSVKHPRIINYHGGGFVAGDKKYREGLADYFVNNLVDEKVYFINANYRLANGKDVVFPTPIIDCANVLKWVEENEEKYNFDMNNVYLCGDSAGGYVCICMVNLTLDNDYAESIGAYKPNFKFKGGLFGCGPYNILSSLKTKLYGLNVGEIVGKPMTGLKKVDDEAIKNYKWLKEIEPMNYVSAEYPEIFFIHAEYDEFCPGHAKTVMAKLDELGVPHEDFYMEDKQIVNHCFYLSQKNEKGKMALSQAVEYFKRMMNS